MPEDRVQGLAAPTRPNVLLDPNFDEVDALLQAANQPLTRAMTATPVVTRRRRCESTGRCDIRRILATSLSSGEFLTYHQSSRTSENVLMTWKSLKWGGFLNHNDGVQSRKRLYGDHPHLNRRRRA
jgi:hypothetical protein